MKFSSLLFATTAAAAAIEVQQGGCKLPSPGAPELRKTAHRKYFSAGSALLQSPSTFRLEARLLTEPSIYLEGKSQWKQGR
jgi:hypothetical protein